MRGSVTYEESMLKSLHGSAMMTVVACDVPATSLLDPDVVASAYFKDSYCAPLRRENATIPEIFFALFGHHSIWLKVILIARNRIAAVFGLEVATISEIMNTEMKSGYDVGDKIGPWPIFALTQTELIAGRDNGHLDFRLSVLRVCEQDKPRVVVSTICSVHNLFGKIYLFFIVPFHIWGVRRLIYAAVRSGRL